MNKINNKPFYWKNSKIILFLKLASFYFLFLSLVEGIPSSSLYFAMVLRAMLQPLFLKYKDIFSSDKGEDLFSDFMSSSIVFFISRHSEFNMKRDFIAIIPWGVSINLSLISLEIVDS